jgi:nucleoid-associated protein YgaU
MGMFDFVTNAGSKLGGAVFDMLNEKEDINKPATISKERMDELRKANIENTIKDMGLPVEALDVNVNDGKVVLNGNVANQADLEKVAIAAGNQEGISQVDAQIAVANPEAEALLYTVVSGDTLGKIAKEHLGASGKYMQIFEANEPMLTDPNKIYPGQVLRIPQ